LESDAICDSNESKVLEGRTVAFSPAETMTPISCPFVSTTGDPIEPDEVAAVISKRLDSKVEMVAWRGAPSLPANPLPTIPTGAPT
jgi:hypothetical protein